MCVCVCVCVCVCSGKEEGQLDATYWVQRTISCITQSNVPEDGQNCCPKHVELIWIYQ